MARRTTTRRRSTTRRAPARRSYSPTRRRASTRRAPARAQTLRLVIEAAPAALGAQLGQAASQEVLAARETAPKKAKL